MAANPDQEARERGKASTVVEDDQKHDGKIIYQKKEQNDQLDKTGNYGDLRNTPGSNVDYFAGTQSLLIIVVLLLACIVGFSSRLFAVIRFESIIHEFDPWYVVYDVCGIELKWNYLHNTKFRQKLILNEHGKLYSIKKTCFKLIFKESSICTSYSGNLAY